MEVVDKAFELEYSTALHVPPTTILIAAKTRSFLSDVVTHDGKQYRAEETDESKAMRWGKLAATGQMECTYRLTLIDTPSPTT